MYFDLWTNNPKEMTEYIDYTFETHFGKPVPACVPGPVLKDYFLGEMYMYVSIKSFKVCHSKNRTISNNQGYAQMIKISTAKFH